MAKKKTKEEPLEPTALVPVAPIKREIVMEGDPEAQLEFATKAANALMKVVSQKPKPVMIRGKQYLEYGDWQVLGRFYGATVEIEWTHKLDNGYEARALVKRNGEIISSAEGMCTRDEQRWGDADEYAVRSMAQTRTAAKALRNAFGWVAELAGYSATPAEEMPAQVMREDRGADREVTIDVGEPAMRTDMPMPDERYAKLPRSKTEDSEPFYDVPDDVPGQKRVIVTQLKKLGADVSNKDIIERYVAEKTELALVEANYPAIIKKLNEII